MIYWPTIYAYSIIGKAQRLYETSRFGIFWYFLSMPGAWHSWESTFEPQVSRYNRNLYLFDPNAKSYSAFIEESIILLLLYRSNEFLWGKEITTKLTDRSWIGWNSIDHSPVTKTFIHINHTSHVFASSIWINFEEPFVNIIFV